MSWRVGELPLAEASRRLRRPPGRPRLHPQRLHRGETVVRPTSETRHGSGGPHRPEVRDTAGPRLLSARDTARYLALGYETVLDLAKRGALRPVRFDGMRKLLFDRVDLDLMIEQSK